VTDAQRAVLEGWVRRRSTAQALAQRSRIVLDDGPMVAVCSIEKDEVLDALGVRTTTNPIQLGLWAGSGPVVVLATYASLVDRDDPNDPAGQRKVRGPLEAALAGGEPM
jgi:hypothetical protein